mgnify:CR=1 FL=1
MEAAPTAHLTGLSSTEGLHRVAIRAVATILASGVIAVLLLFASRSPVATAAELGHVELGLPLAWVAQDQSYFNPPTFPREASFVTPWEHPITISVPMLLVNVVIISAMLWLISQAWRRLANRRATQA